MEKKARRCRHHCRACGFHGTSLRAFDAHRIGTPQERECGIPDGIEGLRLVADDGVCEIGYAEPIEDVEIFEHEDSDQIRQRYGA